jgi:hypothetical protein
MRLKLGGNVTPAAGIVNSIFPAKIRQMGVTYSQIQTLSLTGGRPFPLLPPVVVQTLWAPHLFAFFAKGWRLSLAASHF